MSVNTCEFKKLALIAAVGTAALTAASDASAAGFALAEHSAAGLGRSYAGAGVIGDDLSAMSYNPAGLTLLSGTRVQFGGTFFSLDFKYKGFDGTNENGRGVPSGTPQIYITHQINDQLWAGFGLTVPYGLRTSYSKDWSGSSRGIDASVTAIEANPTIAWKANDMFSFGLGMTIMYTHDKFSNGLGEGLNGVFKYKGSDWCLGYDVGIMFSPIEKVRLGLSYRSSYHVKAKGDYSMVASMSMMGMSIPLADGTKYGYGYLNTPDSVYFSGTWEATERFRPSFLIRFSNWHHFDTMTFKTKDPDALGPTAAALGLNSVSVDNYWRAAWLFTVGFDYKFTKEFTGRFGVGIETNPLRDQRYKTAIVPETSRLWLTTGASWVPYKDWQIDLGLGYFRGIGGKQLFNLDNMTHTYTEAGKYTHVQAWLAALAVQYKF